jgi:hypothetical protein
MHLVQIVFHSEFWEEIEAILDERQIGHFVRFPRLQGKDRDGKHCGSQVFPGSVSVVQIWTEDENIDGLFDRLSDFQQAREAHHHLEAWVFPVARRL